MGTWGDPNLGRAGAPDPGEVWRFFPVAHLSLWGSSARSWLWGRGGRTGGHGKGRKGRKGGWPASGKERGKEGSLRAS